MPPQFENNVKPNNPETKPAKSHKFLITLFVLFLASAAFAWWYLCNLPQDLESETFATQTSEFSDWKTYRNEEYGFEFKYFDPNNDIILEKDTRRGEFLFSSKKLKERLPYGTDPSPIVNRIYVYPTKYTTPMEWLNNENNPEIPTYKDRIAMLGISTTTIAGVPAITVFDPISDGSCVSDFVLFINNGYVYKVTCPGTENQVLSTFKFTK